MNPQQYSTALRQAEDLERKINDLLDDKNHPMARSLLSSAKQLVDEFEVKKNPRTIENRVKSIMQLLHHIRGDGDKIMDFRHTEGFHKSYEHMMMSLRKFDNY